jgi:hypothetical protein
VSHTIDPTTEGLEIGLEAGNESAASSFGSSVMQHRRVAEDWMAIKTMFQACLVTPRLFL